MRYELYVQVSVYERLGPKVRTLIFVPGFLKTDLSARTTFSLVNWNHLSSRDLAVSLRLVLVVVELRAGTVQGVSFFHILSGKDIVI